MLSPTTSTTRVFSVAIIVMVVLTVLGLGTFQLYLWVKQSALADLELRVDADIKRYAATLRNEIDKYQSLPQILATNGQLSELLEETDSHKREQLTEHLNRYFEKINVTSGSSDIYLLDNHGTTISASNWYRSNTFIGRNFSYRPYYTSAIKGIPGRYFALGTTSRKRGYYFSYPIYSETAIAGVVVVKIDLNDIEDQWSDPLLDLLVTDDDGVVFISTKPEWKFHSIGNLTAKDVTRIRESRRYPDQELLSLNLQDQQSLSTQAKLSSLQSQQKGETNVYLKMDHPMAEEQLHVVGLAKLTEVNKRVREQLFLIIGSFLLTLLIVAVVIQKRRIAEERSRFQQQQTAVLEANEARVSGILNNTQAGLLTLDSEGIIETANPTAESLLDYLPGELIGRAFSSLICENDYPEITKVNSPQAPMVLETWAFDKSGQRFPIELSIGDLTVDGQPKRLLTLHDIRERKKYEQHLQESRDELEARVKERTQDLTLINEKLTTEIIEHKQTQDELVQAGKLAVLGQLSAGINHELNQPLTAIRSYAENSKQFINHGDLTTAQTNLDDIAQLTEHMSKIISPLKVFSRKSAGQPEPVNLKLIQDGATSIINPHLEENAVELIWPDNLLKKYVIGDVVRLEQVIVNLLSNAIDAMADCANKQIEISLSEEKDTIHLMFRDNGPGIPEAEIHRVFEPFFTTKSLKQQGLGLGLSISQRITESLGGEIKVANHADGGAIFTLVLKKASIDQEN